VVGYHPLNFYDILAYRRNESALKMSDNGKKYYTKLAPEKNQKKISLCGVKTQENKIYL
jgi:hypothetical protein